MGNCNWIYVLSSYFGLFSGNQQDNFARGKNENKEERKL